MLNFYIPDFYNHYHINLALIDLINNKPEMFYDDFKIAGVFGNFPSCTWNGGTLQEGRVLSQNEQLFIANEFNKREIPLLLTMTNPLIEERDLSDRFSNFILFNLNNGFNQVIINSSILEDYIRKVFPDYKLVKSILATEYEFYDDSDQYEMSVLRKHKNSDIEFLKQIKNKHKIKLLVNETCNDDCPHKYNHYKTFARKQMYLTEEDIGQIDIICANNRENNFNDFLSMPNCITREKIKTIYEPLGFTNFKISGRDVGNGIITTYAHFFVKPEYYLDFINYMLKSMIDDYELSKLE